MEFFLLPGLLLPRLLIETVVHLLSDVLHGTAHRSIVEVGFEYLVSIFGAQKGSILVEAQSDYLFFGDGWVVVGVLGGLFNLRVAEDGRVVVVGHGGVVIFFYGGFRGNGNSARQFAFSASFLGDRFLASIGILLLSVEIGLPGVKSKRLELIKDTRS